MLSPVRTLAVVIAAGLTLPQALSGQAPKSEHDAHRLHGDPTSYIAALEDPKRDAYQKPQEVVLPYQYFLIFQAQE